MWAVQEIKGKEVITAVWVAEDGSGLFGVFNVGGSDGMLRVPLEDGTYADLLDGLGHPDAGAPGGGAEADDWTMSNGQPVMLSTMSLREVGSSAVLQFEAGQLLPVQGMSNFLYYHEAAHSVFD